MKKIFLAIIALWITNVSAQFPNIKIDDVGNPEEPSIFINPKDHNNIVAGANINYIYNSFDGGQSWIKKSMTSTYGVWGDPCIITDTSGEFYFFHLSNPPPDSGTWIDRIVCQKSTDGGVSWSAGTYMGLNGERAQDKEWAVVDQQTNTIYVTWTQFDEYGSNHPNDSSLILFSKSTDGALTWSNAKRINQLAGDCIDSDNTTEGAVPAVGPNGEVYVSWSNRDTLFFDKSLDGGVTWLDTDIVIGEQPGGWDYTIPGLQRCNGLPVTKCDLSGGPDHGSIYVNWSDQRNGTDNTDIFISKSTDGGNTWSTPLKVNDDNDNKHQFLTWMDVDQSTGIIYIIFYDRRNYSNNNTDVYLAYSTDGGNSFINQQISEMPFIPNTSAFFGDYSNIHAVNGKIVPIWTRQDGSFTSVWTALIDFSTLLEESPSFKADHFMLHQNYPNPFSDITMITMEIEESEYYTLSLYDLPGRKIVDLISNEFLQEGQHSITLDASLFQLSESTYFYTLRKGNELQTKKLVFLNK
jgi:hypothetical protein